MNEIFEQNKRRNENVDENSLPAPIKTIQINHYNSNTNS